MSAHFDHEPSLMVPISTHNATSKVKDERQSVNAESHKPRHRAHKRRNDSQQRIEQAKSTREGSVLGRRRVAAHELRAFYMVVWIAVFVAAFGVADGVDVAGEGDADSEDDGAADELVKS